MDMRVFVSVIVPGGCLASMDNRWVAMVAMAAMTAMAAWLLGSCSIDLRGSTNAIPRGNTTKLVYKLSVD